MKCTACNYEIKLTTNFCENCGTIVSEDNGRNELIHLGNLSPELKNENRAQKLIFIGLIVICSSMIYNFLLRRIIHFMHKLDLYETLEPISIAIGVALAGSLLMIAFGLRTGRRKVLALIFASICTVIQMYWIIDRLFPFESAFEFIRF